MGFLKKDKPQGEEQAQAEQPEVVGEQAEAEQAEPEAESADAEPEAAAEEPAVEGDPLPEHLAMRHPDHGSCDGYEADADGIIQVPVAEVEVMLSHGFIPANAEAEEA